MTSTSSPIDTSTTLRTQSASPPRQTAAVTTRLELGALSILDGSPARPDVGDRLRAAAEEMLTAFAASTIHSEPLFTTAVVAGSTVAAGFAGTAARLANVNGASPVHTPLAQMTEYRTVSQGQVTINGRSVQIDPAKTTLEGFVAKLSALGNVRATLDPWSGNLTVTSANPHGAMQVTDDSGLLAALGIVGQLVNPFPAQSQAGAEHTRADERSRRFTLRAATYTSTAGPTTITETQTGTRIISNSRDVGSAVARAAAAFTRVLTSIAQERNDDEFVNELVTASSDAVAALRDAGLAGFTVGGHGADIRLVVDQEALAAALDSLPESQQAIRWVSAILDELTARVSAAAAREPEPRKANSTAQSLVRARMANDQAAAALLFMKALERATGQQSVVQDTVDSSADGALDFATRMVLKAQLEAAQAPGAGSLINSLITNRV